MDKVFEDMFGCTASRIYEKLGQDYELNIEMYPEDYQTDMAKKELIGRMILQTNFDKDIIPVDAMIDWYKENRKKYE